MALKRTPLQILIRRAAATAASLLVVTSASACGLLDGPAESESEGRGSQNSDEVTLLEQGTDTLELEVGETVQVSLGTGSQGVGDAWGVVAPESADVVEAEAILGDAVAVPEDGSENSDAPGSSQPYAVSLTGVAPGTETVRVLYCTRSAIEEGCDQSRGTLEPPVEPVEITVTVR